MFSNSIFFYYFVCYFPTKLSTLQAKVWQDIMNEMLLLFSLCPRSPFSRLYPAVWKQYTHSRLSVLFLQGMAGQRTVNIDSRIHSIYAHSKAQADNESCKNSKWKLSENQSIYTADDFIAPRRVIKGYNQNTIWTESMMCCQLEDYSFRFVPVWKNKQQSNHICSNALTFKTIGQDIPDGLKTEQCSLFLF